MQVSCQVNALTMLPPWIAPLTQCTGDWTDPTAELTTLKEKNPLTLSRRLSIPQSANQPPAQLLQTVNWPSIHSVIKQLLFPYSPHWINLDMKRMTMIMILFTTIMSTYFFFR